ncbi:MAG: hypothetical protein KatS3mg108_0419 [Isosphaeraceae bacterium]|jgi:hypothetical protein|nr:MAG: hypothetical protein KatS3mg108_0419 [Isosphaeraceae bacterium]
MTLHLRLVSLLVLLPSWVLAQTVRIDGDARNGFRLLRDGQPYFVRGVGVDGGSLAAAARAGANSMRTWGSDNLGQRLDEAHQLGLTVCAGIWLGHARHGFDYGDPAALNRQRELVRQVVTAHKDHPALLVWALGNEMEGDGRDERIWQHIEELAQLVKQIDPNHPTMTVIAELGQNGAKLQAIERLCPSIDIVGVNSYAGAASLPQRYAQAGGTRPYLLTEFGPAGWWESPKTDWGAPVEPTSTEKVAAYAHAYDHAVRDQPLCLGSYAFLWGWKQEATATWFGLLLPGNRRLAAVDFLTERWTGKPPANRCPTIGPLEIDGQAVRAPDATLRASIQAADPEGEPLRTTWTLRREGQARGGGDREAAPPVIAGAVLEAGTHQARIRLPRQPGAYRIFVEVEDPHGNAATANRPVLVADP